MYLVKVFQDQCANIENFLLISEEALENFETEMLGRGIHQLNLTNLIPTYIMLRMLCLKTQTILYMEGLK